jgi:hypothetical protein
LTRLLAGNLPCLKHRARLRRAVACTGNSI